MERGFRVLGLDAILGAWCLTRQNPVRPKPYLRRSSMVSTVRSTLLLCLLLPILSPAPAFSQDTARVNIRGTILDSGSGLPIEDVEVRLAELGLLLLTDSAGEFVIPDLPLGTYQMSLQKDGYKDVQGPLRVLRSGSMALRLDPLAAPADLEASRMLGSVKDGESGVPLEGATVTLEGIAGEYITDEDGRFTIPSVPPGARQLEVSLLGYATRTDSIVVPSGSLLSIEVALAVEPIRLDPLAVTVERRNLDLELAGFYDRRAWEPGAFLTQEAIEARHPGATVDLFEGIPGVRVVREGIRHRVALTGNRAMSLLHDPSKEPCYPAVWIDGILMRRTAHSDSHGDLPTLDELVSPHDIAGLEIYQSTARIPVQFNVQGACGVIVVWRRAGRGGGR
jgi:hypothetical protein